MNFPNVPIDESLFESNEMMRAYWERSTENRNVHFVADLRYEEDTPDDFAELRALSMETFTASTVVQESPEALVVNNTVGLVEEVPADAVVVPKSDEVVSGRAITGGQTAAIVVVAVVVVAYLYISYNASRRRV